MALALEEAPGGAEPADHIGLTGGEELRRFDHLLVQTQHRLDAVVLVPRHRGGTERDALGGELVKVRDVVKTRPGIDHPDARSPALVGVPQGMRTELGSAKLHGAHSL